jgi:hypothetical protein
MPETVSAVVSTEAPGRICQLPAAKVATRSIDGSVPPRFAGL